MPQCWYWRTAVAGSPQRSRSPMIRTAGPPVARRIWYSSGVPASSPGRCHPLRTRTSRGRSQISSLAASSAASSPASSASCRRRSSSTMIFRLTLACSCACSAMRQSSPLCFVAALRRRPKPAPTPRRVEAAASQGAGGGLILLPLLNSLFQKLQHEREHLLFLPELSRLEGFIQSTPAKFTYYLVNEN